MAKQQFNPRRVLSLISSNLLAEFFRRRNELTEVPWSTRAENDMQPLYDAWDRLPEAQRRGAQVILQDINEFSDEHRLTVLAQEVRRCGEVYLREFADIECCVDKAMWAYLHLPDSFTSAVLLARADAFSTGRYWVKHIGLPRNPRNLHFNDEMKRNLQRALCEYYVRSQGRGRACHVEHLQRANGAEYFFAYLEDYPDNRIVFDAGQMRKQAQRGAFDNVFVFDPRNGTLELFAMGGKEVQQQLLRLFCRSVLSVDTDSAPPAQSAYNLEGLKDVHFPLPTDPTDGIAEVRVQRIWLQAEPRRRITLEANPRGHRNDIYEMIDEHLLTRAVPLSQVKVARVAIRLAFANTVGRAKTLSFEVGLPNTCNLKSKPDEMREIGERCLKMWGVARD